MEDYALNIKSGMDGEYSFSIHAIDGNAQYYYKDVDENGNITLRYSKTAFENYIECVYHVDAFGPTRILSDDFNDSHLLFYQAEGRFYKNLNNFHNFSKPGDHVVKFYFNELAEDFSNMFKGIQLSESEYTAINLVSVDLTHLTPDNIINMSHMFHGATKAINIKICESYPKLANSSYMFKDCVLLTNIVENLSLNSVVNSDYMFYSCGRATLPKMVTGSSLTSTNYMYSNCQMSIIDLTGMDVSNVTSMAGMFHRCTKLNSLDISNWNPSKLTDANYMFYRTERLTNISDYLWIVLLDHEVNCDYMCSRNGSPNVSLINEFKTKGYISANNMFSRMGNLRSVEISINDIKNSHHMFWDSQLLSSASINVANSLNCEFMFASCYSLNTVNVSAYYFGSSYRRYSSIESAVGMFQDCKELRDVSIIASSIGGNIDNMFYNCYNLTNFSNIAPIAGSKLDEEDRYITSTISATSMNNTFYNCGMWELDMRGIDMSGCESFNGTFNDCNNLNTIKLNPCMTSINTTNENNIFNKVIGVKLDDSATFVFYANPSLLINGETLDNHWGSIIRNNQISAGITSTNIDIQDNSSECE